MQNETTLSQISRLPQMTPPELRDLWRELFGAFPPQVNRAYLQRRLAYRIQELAMGGGSEDIDKRLDTLFSTTPPKPIQHKSAKATSARLENKHGN